MEPAFYRGDILFLTNPPNAIYDIGDITVYKVCVEAIQWFDTVALPQTGPCVCHNHPG
jgi:hypothetical protein